MHDKSGNISRVSISHQDSDLSSLLGTEIHNPILTVTNDALATIASLNESSLASFPGGLGTTLSLFINKISHSESGKMPTLLQLSVVKERHRPSDE